MKPGDKVILNVPENPRVHGSTAYIFQIEEWGAHVATRATATGHFRAHWSEMTTEGQPDHPNTNEVDYSGDQCKDCGSLSLVRTGSCLTCQQCGWNGGCG
jgi:hypothetical protein